LRSDQDLKVSRIRLTGLWRPYGDEHSPHLRGLGLDINYITNGTEEVYYNISSSSNENIYAKKIREKIYRGSIPTNISQFFSPWQMCGRYKSRDSSRPTTVNTCQKNERLDGLERDHLNHLHLSFLPEP
jgi:hypothetical protein